MIFFPKVSFYSHLPKLSSHVKQRLYPLPFHLFFFLLGLNQEHSWISTPIVSQFRLDTSAPVLSTSSPTIRCSPSKSPRASVLPCPRLSTQQMKSCSLNPLLLLQPSGWKHRVPQRGVEKTVVCLSGGIHCIWKDNERLVRRRTSGWWGAEGLQACAGGCGSSAFPAAWGKGNSCSLSQPPLRISYICPLAFCLLLCSQSLLSFPSLLTLSITLLPLSLISFFQKVFDSPCSLFRSWWKIQS